MASHLVLVGGGHVHLTVLKNLADFTGKGHSVTVIGPGPYHYYSGMGPGMLGGYYRPSELRFNVKKMAEDRGARFVQGKVVALDPGNRRLTLDSGGTVDYDVVSFNVGSAIPAGFVQPDQDNVLAVKPIENLYRFRERVLEAIGKGFPRLAVVGGGPAAFEVAGNLERLVRENAGKARITVFGGHEFFGHLPRRASKLARKTLIGRCVEIVEDGFVQNMSDGRLTLENGKEYVYDQAIVAVGVKAPEMFRESGLPTAEKGELLVNGHLQCTECPEVFGGGDCVQLPDGSLAKVGVYAVRENPILYKNLMAALEGGPMETFEPQKDYMLIFNPGDGKGILVWKGLTVDGAPMFWMKNHIDRKFMRQFQVSGEQQNPEGL